MSEHLQLYFKRWRIHINDIVTVSTKFKSLMYADDTTIYFNLEYFSGIDVKENVANELNVKHPYKMVRM